MVAVYKGVGELLRRYTTGKIPKAFKVTTVIFLFLTRLALKGGLQTSIESARLLLTRPYPESLLRLPRWYSGISGKH